MLPTTFSGNQKQPLIIANYSVPHSWEDFLFLFGMASCQVSNLVLGNALTTIIWKTLENLVN